MKLPMINNNCAFGELPLVRRGYNPYCFIATISVLFAFFVWEPVFAWGAALKSMLPRQVVNLDGEWQLEQGSLVAPPQVYRHRVPVPGLVDMAQPALTEIGKKSAQRQAFWYRKSFKVSSRIPDIALIKFGKARYGIQVILNGQILGEHLPCFTPAYFNAAPYLKGEGKENELIVRVGADREGLPTDMPTGWDFEKYLYIPGIYDSVELILAGAPYLANVQAVPRIETGIVQMAIDVETIQEKEGVIVEAEIVEVKSGKVVGKGKTSPFNFKTGEKKTLDLSIAIKNCRLWSPEDPFLYEARVRTSMDAVRFRFGMRSFKMNPQTKRAELNGKTYYLRGSNVTLYRFFEDSQRRDLPWNHEWVRGLHQKVKSMHWNSLRYCIGFPPEFWYEIADEVGVLIQDEFPIWLLGGAPEKPVAEKIIPQYRDWMHERWNHPSVVIWDAQNESNTAETGKAIQAVRNLDLSDRPWENGWSEPQSTQDCVEAHPYLFIRTWNKQKPFRMSEMSQVSGIPTLQAAQKKLTVPIIINEYAWLWLDRDGNPTCLTDKVYESLLGNNSTVEQRRLIYAKYLAAKTEFWRSRRECAGVLHFCILGYSRPGDKPRPEGGATSDHFKNVEKLVLEPQFEKYVRNAFNPLGIMIDFWEETVLAGQKLAIPVAVINDRYEPWKGKVAIRIVKDGRNVASNTSNVLVDPLGKQVVTSEIVLPAKPGEYQLIAEIQDVDGKKVRSYRDICIK